ncbi:MAG: phosphohistidine phosphatase SixA [Caldimonas sp.]
MDLILWRHAEAEDAGDGEGDMQRSLTSKGERQAERMAEWLNRRLTHSTRIVASPAVRCQQTAKAIGRKFRTLPEIAPGASAQTVLQASGWPDGAHPVLVVGHQPTLGLVASLLLTGVAQPWAVKKAAVWWLRRRAHSDDGEIVLHAMQSVDAL